MKAIAASQPSTPTNPETLRRLASVAVSRNHFKALARYLSHGLNPNAICYEGGMREFQSLIEKAAENDSLECFVALSDAGALDASSMQFLFRPLGGEHKILQHLLASGRLDPFGIAYEKYTCYELAILCNDSTSVDIVQAAQAEREACDLLKSTYPPSRASSPRTRSI